jgi:hypothetical protein
MWQIDASEEAVGDDSNALCLNVSRAPPVVAQVDRSRFSHRLHLQEGTGVVNVHNAGMAMY